MKSLRLFFLVFILLFESIGSLSATSLIIPVQLTIENGNYDNSFINIKKNGEALYSLPGEKNLRLKLELDADYILSFSKNGYITKQIHVRTDIPKERVRGGLDPYKIGVRLFKQYEGVNIVVYNQPVAFIRYLIDTDEMGYDVDYTKSILSDLEVAETTLKKMAQEEREQIALSIKLRLSSPILIANNKEQKEPNSSSVSNSSLDSNELGSQNGGVSKNKDSEKETIKATVFSGEEKQSSEISPSLGEDVGHSIDVESGNDKNKPVLAIERGEEKSVTVNKVISESTKSVSVSDEPNRKITSILISDGERPKLYKKIEYKWGGKFYFKDDKISISDQLFYLYTGGN